MNYYNQNNNTYGKNKSSLEALKKHKTAKTMLLLGSIVAFGGFLVSSTLALALSFRLSTIVVPIMALGTTALTVSGYRAENKEYKALKKEIKFYNNQKEQNLFKNAAKKETSFRKESYINKKSIASNQNILLEEDNEITL